MLSEFEILKTYGSQLKNGICPKEILPDLFVVLDRPQSPIPEYLIMNGTRDIESTNRFFCENKFDIASGNLSPDTIKEIYTHLKVLANDAVNDRRNVLTELYFKMLKFQFVPKTQTSETRKWLIKQYRTFIWAYKTYSYEKYAINEITPEMVKHCYDEAREDLIRIYELSASAIPKDIPKEYDFNKIKNNDTVFIYNFADTYSVIGKG
ncbi:MAG: hypothetical protein J6A75_10765 [Lachnospiraceae bacterium]|nr:hypothetical protein [Lachnospiraceae bacterium]